MQQIPELDKVLKSPEIINAFEVIDRRDFVVSDLKADAYLDIPLHIGEGQTISQPSTVAFMLELLDLKVDQKVLDVGAGSGWTTTLIAQIIGHTGVVFGIERIEKLVEFGQKNLAKYKFANASISQAGRQLGLPDNAPFDRILVSAATDSVPAELVDQLKNGGKMVIPIKNSIYKIVKNGDETLIDKYYGYVFVPLIG